LVEKFVDSTSIGKKGYNKIEISFYVNDSFPDAFVRMFFCSKGNFNEVRKTNWWYRNEFIFDGSAGLLYADKGLYPEISDFNNDGYNDFIYRSGIPANLANILQTLFIYNPKEDKLIHIRNSEQYPNLQYNKELDCIIAYWQTSTATEYFLRIEQDTLKEFARIDMIGDEVYVYEIDNKNNEILIEQRKYDFENGGFLFSNYKPLKELKMKVE
jgi:hypothetical protein